MREYSKYLEKIVGILTFLLPLFLIINYNFYPFPLLYSRVFVLFIFIIVIFLTMPLKSNNIPHIRILDYILIILAISVAIFSYFKLDEMSEIAGIGTPLYQIIFATIGIIVTLEATRRVAGNVLPIIALVFIGFAIYRGYDYSRIVSGIYSYDGIFGTVLSLALSVVFIFIIFGNMLNAANFGTFLIKLGTSLFGGMSGGPAKIAVFASALFGSISGSAVANVVGTGTFTIPLMKKLGFQPKVAGAVEASASTGGQIMPPVMAAGAFMIAEILQVSYLEVCKSALLPALAYFVCVYASVDAYSKFMGLKGIAKNERPSFKEAFFEGAHLFIILVIMILLLLKRVDPIRAAFLSILFLLPVSFLKRKTGITPNKFINAFKNSTKGALVVVSACAVVGSIMSCIGLTGVAGKMASAIINIGGGNLLFVLILIMITCLIFGMALPTTASYLVCIAITGSALIRLGVVPMCAHLFVFYFAALSAITPPVALAAYAAAGLSEANMLETAVEACKISATAFILPYIFVYVPSMVFKAATPSIPIIIILFVIILPCSLAWGLWGHNLFKKINIIERIFYLGLPIYLIYSAINKQLKNNLLIVIILWLLVLSINYLIDKRKKVPASF